MASQPLKAGDAVIIVDVQNDFCPGGALEVPHGDEVIAELNAWAAAASAANLPVVASRDWHTVNHVSFAERGGPWPEHCVQDTWGAAFHPDLKLPPETVLVSKGTSFDRDAYSAFDGTGLEGWLRRQGVKRLWVGGLAEDVCVFHTVRDARRAGFDTHLVKTATRPVFPDKENEVLQQLRAEGAVVEEGEPA